jgi:hypothetical protein
MCCFFAALLFLGPRFGFLVYWLIAPVRVNAALQAFNFPFLASLLALIFAPWTILMYAMIFPLNGYDWVWIGFAIMLDVMGWIGSFAHRKSVPGYPENDPLEVAPVTPPATPPAK